jgi:ketosteroid isomerase-like protein
MRHFLASLLFAASLGHAGAGDEPAASLHALLDTFLAGAGSQDAAIHDRFWADDLVYTSSAGQRFGKAEIMAGLEQGDDEAGNDQEYRARDVHFRVFGDTAALTFTLVATTEAGESTRYYNSGVFRKRNGQWQAIVWQATLASD